MFAVGVLYLLFEKSILAGAESADEELVTSGVDVTSRIIVGFQVRFLVPGHFQLLTRERSDSLLWQCTSQDLVCCIFSLGRVY